MSGFDNEVVYGKNADFSSVDNQNVLESNGLVTNGQIWIGSTATNAGGTHINVGSITSPDSSVTVGYSSPNITLTVPVVDPSITLNGDSGSATGSTLTLYASQITNNCGATVSFDNSGTISTLSLSDPSVLANQLIGRDCGNLTVTGGANCGFGVSSLNALTSGENNCSYGAQAMLLHQDGSVNCAFGTRALQTSVSGSSNCAFGYQALNSCTGSQNVAVGESALSAYAGNGNIGIGYLACRDVQGAGNIGIGFISLVNCSTGQNNTAVGYQALTNLGTGDSNTVLGYNSGSGLTLTDSGNILIDNVGTAGDNTTIRIGTAQTSCFIQGIAGVTVANSAAVLIDTTTGELGTIASSERYKENIVDMPEDVSVLHLRPISFNFKSDENKQIQYGLLAEDVALDFPYLCTYKDGQPETVKYHELCVFLLAEIKRLDKRIKQLESA